MLELPVGKVFCDQLLVYAYDHHDDDSDPELGERMKIHLCFP